MRVAAATRQCCPRCDMPAGVLALLTSMVAYYACARCSHRWQVRRRERDGAPAISRIATVTAAL